MALFPPQYPSAWESRTIRIPKWLYYVVCALAFGVLTVFTYVSAQNANTSTVVFTVVYIIGAIIATYIVSRREDTRVRGLFYDNEGHELTPICKW